MRGAISKKRGSQPRWPEKAEGMERSKRARKRKLDTAKTDLKPPLAVLRRAGCPSSEYRKMESEGPAEKYRAVIDGETQDEPVGQRWGKVESALLRRRRSHSPTAPRCLRTARYRRTTLASTSLATKSSAGTECFICPRVRFAVRPDRMRSMRIPRRSPFVVSWTRYGNGLNGRHLWEPRN